VAVCYEALSILAVVILAGRGEIAVVVWDRCHSVLYHQSFCLAWRSLKPQPAQRPDLGVLLFTARCAIVYSAVLDRMSSVRLSMTLVYQDHIGW